MEDQNQQKPKPTKQVRIRATCGATIEVVENDSVVEASHQIVPIHHFDQTGFQEAFEFLELSRQARQAELDEEYEREQKQNQESEKTMLQNAFCYLTSFFN